MGFPMNKLVQISIPTPADLEKSSYTVQTYTNHCEKCGATYMSIDHPLKTCGKCGADYPGTQTPEVNPVTPWTAQSEFKSFEWREHLAKKGYIDLWAVFRLDEDAKFKALHRFGITASFEWSENEVSVIQGSQTALYLAENNDGFLVDLFTLNCPVVIDWVQWMKKREANLYQSLINTGFIITD